ncbi:hypothetical protein O181_111489 [Austropuccinia psidii MF-1]|uniref:Uncharacterized protein n=1 Tax=Austropuccinia psidii MF-1 TaxID=1389203 RepID=A0A9Q3PRU8_9BASI|nr:hypothetical protein [Austropuccinia psidii MF-1]
MLEKGWNPRLPADTLRKDLIEIHPTASSFKIMLDRKWDKSHKVPDFKIAYLVLASTFNYNNIKGPKKLKYSYVGPFFDFALHGTNAVQVNPTPLTVPPVEQNEDKKIKKVIEERRLRGKNQRECLIRYRNPVHEDEWLAES